MKTIIALALMSGSLAMPMSPALAQNSFPTPGGATVQGIVVMCVVGNVAVPCTGTVTSGSDGTFTTPSGATVEGAVRMCVVANVAVPC